MARIPRLLPLIAIAIGGVVAVRAVGAGPGLFEGAKAWAEEATGAVAPAPGNVAVVAPAPKACALTPEQLAQQAGISPAELRIIQSLSNRRKELDARDTDFATTLPLMVAAEQKLDAKVQALTALKGEIQGLLGQVDAREKAEIDRLVAVYSAMRPKEAAAVFVSLNDDVRLPVAAAMRPRSLAAVMAQMPPAAARDLTEKLARRFRAQQMAARAAVASAAEPLAPTAVPPTTQAANTPTPNTQGPNTQGQATLPKPAATPTASPRPAATPPRRPAARPTPRANRPPSGAAPTSTPPAPTPSAAAPAPVPQAYQAPAATPASSASPRQSVQ